MLTSPPDCSARPSPRLRSQTGWHYSTMQQYHPSYRNGFPPGGGRYPPRRTTSAGRTGWEQTAHDMYWSDLGRRQGRWSHDPRAEWTTKEREAWGPTAGLPWLRKWMPWLVEGGHDKGKVTRVIVFAVRPSLPCGLLPPAFASHGFAWSWRACAAGRRRGLGTLSPRGVGS